MNSSIAEDHAGNIYYNMIGNGFAILNKATGQRRHYNTRKKPKNKGSFASYFILPQFIVPSGRNS